MIVVVKKVEPKVLVEHRQSPGADFIGLPKEEVKKQLVDEQKGLCAYCMRRIEHDQTTKIEHFLSQKNHKSLALNYRNMFAVCNKEVHVCENAKGSKEFKKLNLLSQDIICHIKYHRNGEIYSDDVDLNNDINHILRLNESLYLKCGRETAYKELVKKIMKESGNAKCKRSILVKYKNKLLSTKNGKCIEYLGVYLYFVEKKSK